MSTEGAPAGPIEASLGGPAVTRLFVHGFPPDLLREHLPERPEGRCYAERALLLARAHDLVCLTRRPHPAYLEDLRELGIGPEPAGVVEVPGGDSDALVEALLRDAGARRPLLERLAGAGTLVLDPYRAARRECELARVLARESGVRIREPCRAPELVECADAKDWARARALELGLPVADGEVVEVSTDEAGLARLRAAVGRHRPVTGGVLVRAPRASSGFGTFLLEGEGGREASRWRAIVGRGECRWLVEVFHDVTVSPNVLLHVPPAGPPRLLGVSDQRLDSSLSHHGNLHPSSARTSAEMARTARTFAAFLQAGGYEGWIGFDLCERPRPGSAPDHFLAEVNPRVNAALYPLAALERLRRPPSQRPQGAVLSATVATGVRTYPALRARLGSAFATSAGGVLPYATGGLEHGRVALAAVGPGREEVQALFEEARRRLGDPARGG